MIAHAIVVSEIGKALFLDACHIEHIHVSDDVVDVVRDSYRRARSARTTSSTSSGIRRISGLTKTEFDIVVDQQLGQAVDGAAIFQVTDHGNLEAVDSSQLFTNGEQIQQRLGRMLAHAVAGIDHRLAGIVRRGRGRTDLRVANDETSA